MELSSSESLPNGPCRIYDDIRRLILEGALVSGKTDGTWTPIGSNGDRLAVWSYRQSVRNGAVQMWYGPFYELKADLTHLAALEDTVTRSLAQANRKVKK